MGLFFLFFVMSAPTADSLIEKKLVFSILQYLTEVNSKAPEGVDVESLEVAIQCLSQAFSLDVNDEEHKKQHAIGSPLDQVFRYGLVLDASEDTPISGLLKKALNTAEKNPIKSREEQIFEEKFEQYLKSLTEKGFFTGTEPGTQQYNDRVEKARSRLKEEEEKAKQRRVELAEEKKAEGNTLLRENNIDEAIEKYSEAINLNPYNAIYYANRAAAYTSLRRHDKAIEDCKKATTIDPTYGKAFSRMGLAYFSLGRYHEAVHAYERAKELDPENQSVLQSLEIAKKKHIEKTAEEGGHGHSHGGAPCGHSHDGAAGHGHSHGGAGAPDLSGLMNNPAIQNMVNSFQSQMQTGQAPNISDILSNPEMMSTAAQMMNNPGVSGLLNNPAIMNMASQMLSNPDMLGSMMSNFGGGMGGGAPPQGSPSSGTPPPGTPPPSQ